MNSYYVKFSKILWDRQSDQASVELLGENKYLVAADVHATLNRSPLKRAYPLNRKAYRASEADQKGSRQRQSSSQCDRNRGEFAPPQRRFFLAEYVLLMKDYVSRDKAKILADPQCGG